MIQSLDFQPGAMVQAHNPIYLGGRDLEERGLRPTQQKVCETPS
jgi:hypothetical protein